MAQKLDSTSRAQALGQLMALGWAMVDGRDAIVITLKFKDFSQAWAAMSRIALRAEAMDHHPEWANVYNRLTLTLTTHSCDGLSDLDITLAQAISDIAQQQGGKVVEG